MVVMTGSTTSETKRGCVQYSNLLPNGFNISNQHGKLFRYPSQIIASTVILEQHSGEYNKRGYGRCTYQQPQGQRCSYPRETSVSHGQSCTSSLPVLDKRGAPSTPIASRFAANVASLTTPSRSTATCARHPPFV